MVKENKMRIKSSIIGISPDGKYTIEKDPERGMYYLKTRGKVADNEHSISFKAPSVETRLERWAAIYGIELNPEYLSNSRKSIKSEYGEDYNKRITRTYDLEDGYDFGLAHNCNTKVLDDKLDAKGFLLMNHFADREDYMFTVRQKRTGIEVDFCYDLATGMVSGTYNDRTEPIDGADSEYSIAECVEWFYNNRVDAINEMSWETGLYNSRKVVKSSLSDWERTDMASGPIWDNGKYRIVEKSRDGTHDDITNYYILRDKENLSKDDVHFYTLEEAMESAEHMMSLEQSCKITSARRDEVDSIAADELALCTENDGDLYRQMTTAIIKNLKNKIAKGTYDEQLALKAWLNLVTTEARKYVREFGSPGDTIDRMFNLATREEAAKEVARYYQEHLEE